MYAKTVVLPYHTKTHSTSTTAKNCTHIYETITTKYTAQPNQTEPQKTSQASRSTQRITKKKAVLAIIQLSGIVLKLSVAVYFRHTSTFLVGYTEI